MRGQREVQPAAQDAHGRADGAGVARGQRCRDAQDVRPLAPELVPITPMVLPGLPITPCHWMPNSAICWVDLDDQAFDQHLRAAPVQFVDHRATGGIGARAP